MFNEQRLEEWKKQRDEEEKRIEEETKEYEKNKKNLQAAIHANNYKLDEKYKLQVQEGANSIVESIKEFQMKKRDKKGLEKKANKLHHLKRLLNEGEEPPLPIKDLVEEIRTKPTA